MKNNFSLSIPAPCSEKWDGFTPAPQGRFCGSCSKIVIDFTKMGDADVIDFFRNKPAYTCGRFRPDQLKGYTETTFVRVHPGLTLLKAGLVSLLLVFVSKQASAQNTCSKPNIEVFQHPDQTMAINDGIKPDKIVRGVVQSEEDQSPLPGVNVYLKGSEEGTITDADGRFEFPRKLKEGDVLVFNFIGLEPRECPIPNKISEPIKINMTPAFVGWMGKVAIDEPYTTKPTALRRLWGKVKGLF